MNTQQLESFIQVAESLNFARASEQLNITQSAVSRQIYSLEEELNTKLFYRTTRTVSLTPEGMIFLEHAKHILGQLKIASAKIQHHTNAHIQTLTIGCKSETDLDFLCGILRGCREQIPSFHPVLKIIPHRSLLNQFYQGEIAVLFGFQDELPVKKEVAFKELRKVPLCCVLPTGHPYAQKPELDEQALFSQRLVICNSYTIPAKAVEIQNRVAQHISPENIHVSENPRVILTLIRAGYGCSILPKTMLEDRTITCVPLKNMPPLSYGMIYHKTSHSPLLRAFIQAALDICEAESAARQPDGQGPAPL